MKPGPGGSKEGDGALWRLGQKLQELIPKLYPSDAALPVNYVVDLVAMVVYKHCGGQSAASWPAAAFIKAGLPFSVLLDTLHRLITEESSWSEQPGPRAFLYTVMAELIDRWMEAEEDPHKNIERYIMVDARDDCFTLLELIIMAYHLHESMKGFQSTL